MRGALNSHPPFGHPRGDFHSDKDFSFFPSPASRERAEVSPHKLRRSEHYFPSPPAERERHDFPSPPAEAQAEARWERVRVRGVAIIVAKRHLV